MLTLNPQLKECNRAMRKRANVRRLAVAKAVNFGFVVPLARGKPMSRFSIFLMD